MSNRDDFTKDTRDLLARRVGFLCSNPTCRRSTSGPHSDPNKATNIGVAAHICAAAPGGPRYNAEMTPAERSSVNNGIWLCQTCSTLIDRDEKKYTVEVLTEWKKNAELAAELNQDSPPSSDAVSPSKGLLLGTDYKPTNPIIYRDDLEQPYCTEFYDSNNRFERADQALRSDQPVLCINGELGEGKTTYALHLFNTAEKNDFYGAKALIYWNFGKSGNRNNTSAGINKFIKKLMDVLEIEPDPEENDEEKNVRLIIDRLVEERNVLILDGFESLLVNGPKGFVIGNKSIKTLVNDVAAKGHTVKSFLLLLSEKRVAELDYAANLNVSLAKMDKNDCVSLMRSLGVKGNKRDLLNAAGRLGKNPLAVSLFAKNLGKNYRGVYSKNGPFLLREILTSKDSGIESLLNNKVLRWNNNSCEAKLARLISLIKYPITYDELLLVCQKIRWMNRFNQLSEGEKNTLIGHLDDVGLIYNYSQSQTISMHPAIRENVSLKFSKNIPDGFKECCLGLASFCCEMYEAGPKKDIYDLSRIYDAIYYYTKARKFDKAIDLFWEKINRKREFYSQKVLGVLSEDIYTVSLFFNTGWKVKKGVREEDAAWLYSVAAYLTNSLGDLKGSEELRKEEIRLFEKLGCKKLVACDKMHLARNLMLQGKLEESEKVFEESRSLVLEDEPARSQFRYAAEMDWARLKNNVLSREAFLCCVYKDREHIEKAKRLIENVDVNLLVTSSTGTVNYYTVSFLVNWNDRSADAFPDDLAVIFDDFVRNENRKYTQAYAYFLRALYKSSKLSSEKDSGRVINEILEDIECSKRFAVEAWRMEQYPFLLVCFAEILIEIYKNTKNEDVRRRADGIQKELDETLKEANIPLYSTMKEFNQLHLAIIDGDMSKEAEITAKLIKGPMKKYTQSWIAILKEGC